jgi:hypothetical protein
MPLRLVEVGVNLFRELLAEYQQGTPTSLIENALTVPPHHFDNLGIGDLLPGNWAIPSVDQSKNRVRKACPCSLVNVGASHL